MAWWKWQNEPAKCGTCWYYDNGGCKRYPPQRVYTGDTREKKDAVDVTVWPVVRPEQDWCGEHKSAP